MKAVILAGGLGTRLSEETSVRPKPMVTIGGMPIILHIMKHFSVFGVKEFIICCGYRGYMIKEYFTNYRMYMSDVTIDMARDSITVHKSHVENWKVTLVDTGDNSMTAGRLARVGEFIKNDEEFFFTYGDGLTDANLGAELAFHRKHGKLGTVLGVRPLARYGSLSYKGSVIHDFVEKPQDGEGRINGGYFILCPRVLKLIEGDEEIWEARPMKQLVEAREMMMFPHDGFWHAMDTLRDKNHLEKLWEENRAPWRTWDD